LLHWIDYSQIIVLFGACFLVASLLMLLCRPYARVNRQPA